MATFSDELVLEGVALVDGGGGGGEAAAAAAAATCTASTTAESIQALASVATVEGTLRGKMVLLSLRFLFSLSRLKLRKGQRCCLSMNERGGEEKA